MSGLTVSLAFLLLVASPSDEKKAGILIDSIHAYGGPYSRAPIEEPQLLRERSAGRGHPEGPGAAAATGR